MRLQFAERDVRTLSGGELARILFARALAVEAPVLLADEPVAALDPGHQLRALAHLNEAAKTSSVLVVMHDLSLAARYCDSASICWMQGALLPPVSPARLSPRLRSKLPSGSSFCAPRWTGCRSSRLI